MLAALQKIADEDPTFHVRDDAKPARPDSGMGELHLEIARERLESEYNVALARDVRRSSITKPSWQGEAEHLSSGPPTTNSCLVVRRCGVATLGPVGKDCSSAAKFHRRRPIGCLRCLCALPGCIEAALSGIREAMGSGPKATSCRH